MSVTGFLIKAIKVAACLVVMISFIVLVVMASLRPESLGWKIAGWAAMAAAVVTGVISLSVIRSPGHKKNIEEMEASGIIVTEEYEATRAVQVEEFEDEGPHYLLELADGGVLCLSGQYLEAFDEGPDDRGWPLPRRFPNTRFRAKRHVPSDEIRAISCQGFYLEPLHVFSGYEMAEFEGDLVPFNGDLYRDFTFDQLISAKGRLPRYLSHA